MSYTFSKFPERVSKLFKPRPPLQYKKPTDYPPELRKTRSISPLSTLLSTDALTQYLKDFPSGSDNKHLDTYDEIKNTKADNEKFLESELVKWNPAEDGNIKGTDPFRTVFVGRLPYEVDELELQKLLIKFGDIERVRVVRNKKTNQPRGYAFVLFKDTEGSAKAYREIGVHRGMLVAGRPIIVDIERGRTVKYFKPRRLGGGLGGRGYMKRENLHQLSLTAAANLGKSPDGDRRHKHASAGPGGRFQGHNPSYHSNSYYGSHSGPSYGGSRFSREGSTYVPASSGNHSYISSSATTPPLSEPAQATTAYRSRRDRNTSAEKTNPPSSMDY
ncbi:HCL166Cp [Eremothecium sinecaudum]|uniref:HCL166Cp n=1 Tax=Eremothecium sinecaudum TaxID=45286 RepID=A0A0X8HRA7_9SACH|nr:HCL166Cp [Eremothecium sinecaudum]AMD19985.1 HCL166Cp [Eremothecium sinecaudum]